MHCANFTSLNDDSFDDFVVFDIMNSMVAGTPPLSPHIVHPTDPMARAITSTLFNDLVSREGTGSGGRVTCRVYRFPGCKQTPLLLKNPSQILVVSMALLPNDRRDCEEYQLMD